MAFSAVAVHGRRHSRIKPNRMITYEQRTYDDNITRRAHVTATVKIKQTKIG